MTVFVLDWLLTFVSVGTSIDSTVETGAEFRASIHGEIE